MCYLGTVWLERWSSSSLLSFLTSPPTLPCDRGECTNLQQLLSEAGFGWQLFQGSSEAKEGDTPQSHCLLLLTTARLCYHSSVVLFSFIFCSVSVICPKCILKQNQLLALHLIKHLSRPSLGPAIFSGAGCQRLSILKLTISCFRGFFQCHFQSTK